MKLKMKRPCKLKSTLLLTCIICILIALPTTAAHAAVEDPWGPQIYTPYTGSMQAHSTAARAFALKWTSSQVNTWYYAQQAATMVLVTEYEIRPVTGNPDTYWDSSNCTYASNFPSAYYEYESGTSASANDVAVCCGYAAGFDSTTSYYGSLTLSARSGASYTNKLLVFESEYGMYFSGDALPLQYEIFKNNALFNPTYSW
jgi:hypothetical protein